MSFNFNGSISFDPATQANMAATLVLCQFPHYHHNSFPSHRASSSSSQQLTSIESNLNPSSSQFHSTSLDTRRPAAIITQFRAITCSAAAAIWLHQSSATIPNHHTPPWTSQDQTQSKRRRSLRSQNARSTQAQLVWASLLIITNACNPLLHLQLRSAVAQPCTLQAFITVRLLEL